MILPITSPLPSPQLIAIVEQVKPAEKKPQPKPDYIIKENDTLTSIADAQSVPLTRLWSANPQLANPDVLAVADPLKIPLDSDTLPERAMISSATRSPMAFGESGTAVTGGSSNMYTPGQCTAYAWSRRQDLPGNLGDAWTWATRAAAQGFTVSDKPRVGAIGVARSYGHVVYVEAVNGASVTVSEQNYQGPFIISSRVAPISEFSYIL